MLLKEFYQSMYGKIIVEKIDDDAVIKYKDNDGEQKEMSAKAAKRMAADHPAKIEYDKQADGGDKAAKKSVNIFDKPADEPADEPKDQPAGDDLDKQIKDTEYLFNMYRTSPDPQYQAMAQGEYEKLQKLKAKKGDSKPEASGDDAKQIGGPNGLEIDRDDIATTLMNDPEIAAILGDEDDVYWDDADLVSSKWDDTTIASIDPNSPETIGDLKQKIRDFEAEQGEKQAARDNQEFEPVENDKDINRMQQGMQQAIGGDDYEDVPDRLELQGKMKADNGETIIVWKDTDDGMMMGVDAEGNVYEDGEKARYGIGVSTAGNVFGADQNKQRKAENIVPTGTFRRIQENYIKKNL